MVAQRHGSSKAIGSKGKLVTQCSSKAIGSSKANWYLNLKGIKSLNALWSIGSQGKWYSQQQFGTHGISSKALESSSRL
jgi:hypothetical protein